MHGQRTETASGVIFYIIMYVLGISSAIQFVIAGAFHKSHVRR